MAVPYTLNPSMPVLRRPDGAVQVGWDPRRAVLVRPPAGLTADGLAAVLGSMRSPATITELQHRAAEHGLADPDELTAVITSLAEVGVASCPPRQRRHRAASVRVHGRGPLSDLLVDTLRCSGTRIKHSHQRHAAVAPHDADLVVLSDYLVAEPRMVRELHAEGVPHLPVRVRDGTGLVGPLVIPGVTSCLGCADRHRRDRDAAWPAVATQLREAVGSADRATILATAALALGQVNRVIAAVCGLTAAPDPGPPPTLGATLEFDVGTGAILTRHWARHPLCSC